MSSFERTTFCSELEYTAKRPDRLDFSNYEADQLIILMVLIGDGKFEAAKIPARIILPGDSFVELSFVDKNLEPKFTNKYGLKDNLVDLQGLTIEHGSNNARLKPIESYGLDYFDEMMPPEFTLRSALELT